MKNIIKSFINLLIILFVGASCSSSKEIENNNNSYFNIDNIYYSFVIYNNNIFALADSYIDVIDFNGKIIKEIKIENMHIKEKVEEGNLLEIPCIHIIRENIYLLGKNYINKYSLEGNFIKTIETDKDIYQKNSQIVGNNIFFITNVDYNNAYNNSIAYLDTENDTIVEEEEFKCSNILNYYDEYFVYIYNDDGSLKKFNLEKMKIDTKSVENEDLEYNKYKDKNNKKYMYNNYKIKEENNTVLKLSDINNNEIKIYNDIVYTMSSNILNKKTEFTKIDIAKINKNKKLIIYTDGISFDNNNQIVYAKEKFKKEYPNVDVQLKEISLEKYKETLKVKILANDTDFDIFYLDQDEFTKYASSHALFDFKESEEIMNKINENVYIKYMDSTSYSGKYYGAQINITYDEYFVDKSILDEKNIPLPKDNWNYDEYFEYIKLLESKGIQNCGNISILSIYYGDAIISSGIDIEKKEVSIDRERLINYINNLIDNNSEEISKEDIDLSEDTIEYRETKEEDKYYVKIPVINSEKPKVPIIGKYLSININSKNREMAEKFISFLYDKENILNKYTTGIPPVYKDPYLYNSYTPENNTEQHIITENYMEAYDYFLDNASPVIPFENENTGYIKEDSGKIKSEDISKIVDEIINNFKLRIME